MKVENEQKKNKFIAWCKDYKSDFRKIIFSFLMGYSSVIVVVVVLSFINQDFFKIISSKNTLYSILGCCSSMLAVASVSIEKNNTSLKMGPMLYNFFVILPIFGVMSYFLVDDSIEINTVILTTVTIIGVLLSFYYLVISTNEERIKRKKFEDMSRNAKNLRNQIEKTTQGSVAGAEFDV
ncbi:hypothetical protein CON03_20360 [Bacillus cereus]|nr:hypothetical protein CON03_20360 [Bacillus cereus]